MKTALPWSELAATLSGELHTDDTHRILYATDASVYREKPAAVALPRTEADLVACVRFAAKYNLPITPRAGGTSLAGQATGAGLIVDVSKYLTEIVEINTEEGYAVVQPGVIRDQLNAALRPLGYWFGPNTSTANRCTMGGMFGNNSCGSTSITVGSTRDHVLSARVILADATVHDFSAGTQVPGTDLKEQGSGTLSAVNTFLADLLGKEDNRRAIRAAFPKASIERRNTGYALDLLARQRPFTPDGPEYNLCTLLAGSEGTLGLTVRLKVRILPLPPPGACLAAVHYATIDAAMRATQRAMTHRPFMCEVMDDTILRLARTNPEQAKNAAFVNGDPRAILMVEFRAPTDAAAAQLAQTLSEDLSTDGNLGTVLLSGPAEVSRAWTLRSAGLGILGNMVGDAKAVACIEDTAVALPDLADYIAEVETLMQRYGQQTVYYAHAGAGEIHLRPVLNLKTSAGRQDFHDITRDVAHLVKKYRGSLSGEHGDGRVRAPFLPDMLGPEVYQMIVDLKRAFDPTGLFNPGKIVDAPPMTEQLRYDADAPVPSYPTALDFSADGGLLRSAEKCNGSGDCRKLSGGAMCPSYRALRAEKHSTRGRANLLREVLTQHQHADPFAHPGLNEALDLCLSCKACTAECPSSVNMTHLKAEVAHQQRKRDLRSRMVTANEQLYRFGGRFPRLANFGLRFGGPLVKKLARIAPERSLPPFPAESLRRWFERQPTDHYRHRGPLYLYGDEFVNYQDVHVGRATIELLGKLGYEVRWPNHPASARAHLSKGYLDEAGHLAAANVRRFAPLVSAATPLVGIEPSAILGFRDEFPKLLRGDIKDDALHLASHTYTLDEFLHREFTAGRLGPEDFGPRPVSLTLHVHCHEKALGDAGKCAATLSLPTNFNVRLLDSGCCGMAGSFGYEAEHYALSAQIAEESLLRHLRDLPAEEVVVASGTSCRHQVKDLLGLRAFSTAEALLLSF